MVKLSEMEMRVLKRAHEDMMKATDSDGINKVYRQLRTWNRWHSIGMQRDFSRDDSYNTINDYLKLYRAEAREKLEV